MLQSVGPNRYLYISLWISRHHHPVFINLGGCALPSVYFDEDGKTLGSSRFFLPFACECWVPNHVLGCGIAINPHPKTCTQHLIILSHRIIEWMLIYCNRWMEGCWRCWQPRYHCCILRTDLRWSLRCSSQKISAWQVSLHPMDLKRCPGLDRSG